MIDDFSYIWNGENPGWVVMDALPEHQPIIYNTQTKAVLIIEDENLYEEVLREMLERGIDRLAEFPSS